MHSTKFLFAVPAIAALTIGTTADAAIVVDSFDVGTVDLEVEYPSGAAVDAVTQTDLPPDQVLGRSRFVRLVRLAPTNSEVEINVENDGEFTLRTELYGSVGHEAAYLQYEAPEASSFDLTDGGLADRFRFNVTQWPAAIPGDDYTIQTIMIRLETFDTDGNEVIVNDAKGSTSDPGELSPLHPHGPVDFLFSEGWEVEGTGPFSGEIDFTRVHSIQVRFENFGRDISFGTEAALELSIDSFTVVPEPSSVAVMSCAGGLLLRRRR